MLALIIVFLMQSLIFFLVFFFVSLLSSQKFEGMAVERMADFMFRIDVHYEFLILPEKLVTLSTDQYLWPARSEVETLSDQKQLCAQRVFLVTDYGH